eukprot:CAMPEP_0115080460 /NCGR_PEP_ID=MMETSP0227-20121206/18691_1 /TAXON_ID=89957 /ORGANISM="Polarella glacialis, Strain CCMP 1383" /LENGTH=64 /DNA_ID=CAMNT_0002468107 /DNA_START=374 /DNA_END=568 /DNA_ORIENTATION=-
MGAAPRRNGTIAARRPVAAERKASDCSGAEACSTTVAAAATAAMQASARSPFLAWRRRSDPAEG